jgi:hypothetical protein
MHAAFRSTSFDLVDQVLERPIHLPRMHWWLTMDAAQRAILHCTAE